MQLVLRNWANLQLQVLHATENQLHKTVAKWQISSNDAPMAHPFLICYNYDCWYGCGCAKPTTMSTNDAPSLIGDGGGGGGGSCHCCYLCQQRW